ncbi:hypothetical protein ACT7CZ_17865 [Bacillus cereus]
MSLLLQQTTTTPSGNIPINNPNPTTTKSADRQVADIGDTITFTVTFQKIEGPSPLQMLL